MGGTTSNIKKVFFPPVQQDQFHTHKKLACITCEMHFPPPNLQRPGRMRGKETGQGRKTVQERARVEMMGVAEMARTIFFAVGR